MQQQLLDYFNAISPLTKDESEAIASTITIQTFPKGHLLLREGAISYEAYFVLKGCVRQYYLTDGEERTINFFTENQWVISMTSFSEQQPSNHFMECCEECTLVVGNREKEEGLYRKFPKLETISRKVMEKVFAEQQELMGAYFTDSPEQRYVKLQQNRPDLINRLPQYLLANYIGIQPESLSRIRKRIAGKG